MGKVVDLILFYSSYALIEPVKSLLGREWIA